MSYLNRPRTSILSPLFERPWAGLPESSAGSSTEAIASGNMCKPPGHQGNAFLQYEDAAQICRLKVKGTHL